MNISKLLKFSPSAAERWFYCPVSAVVAAMPRPYEPSIYAARGTGVMKKIEDALDDDFFDADDFDDIVGTTEEVDGHKITYTEEDARAARICYTDILSRVEDGMSLKVEESVSGVYKIDKTIIEQRGRIDFLLEDKDTYEIVDYKNGAGVTVSALNNYQLLSYLMMVVDTYGHKPFYVLRIVQPNAQTKVQTTWRLTHRQFEQVAEHVVASMTRAIQTAKALSEQSEIPLSDYYPGDHCKWCPIEHSCPGRVNKAVSVACMSRIPYEEGGKLKWTLDNAEQIKKVVSGAEKRADEILLGGGEVYGYKMIEAAGKRSVKKYTDLDAAARDALEETIDLEPKMPTIAQLEKIKDDGFDVSAYINEAEPKPKRVTWSTDGKAWCAADEFEAAEIEETEEL